MLPEPGDGMVRLGTLDRQEGLASTRCRPSAAGPSMQFDPDLVTVTRAGSDPAN